MRKGFQDNRIALYEITGSSRERRRAWERLDLRKEQVLGLYSELSVLPLGLSDPDHIPRRPFMDMRMFRRLRAAGIPVAVFYRDVNWRFPHYRNELGLLPRTVAKAFHRLELRQIARSVSHLFLPSMRMFDAVPVDLPRERVSALPPGAYVRNRAGPRTGPLRLLYVGGVRPPNYDLSPMFEVIGDVPGVSLQVCCRELEWQGMRARYDVPANVEIVHESGAGLDGLYAGADVFLMYRRMHRYLEFAMSVKLFEAIGAGLPVIANANCEMGDFVIREGCGWAPADVQELRELVGHLADAPEVARGKARAVEEVRERHTWGARAQEIVSTLQRIRREDRV